MTTARTVGVAVGNGRFQDELCDALAPLLPIERCRTDRELLALVAQHALGGAVVGHDLLGLDRHVLPALVRNDIPTVLLVLERDIPRRLAALALDGGATRVRILPLGAAPSSIAAALTELRTGVVGNLEHAGPFVVEVPRRATTARPHSSRGLLYGFVGPGGTGCTTHVANLLLALGAAEDVVGVDLDPVAPMLVPLLNADPSLGLDGILKAQAAGVSAWNGPLWPTCSPCRRRRALHVGSCWAASHCMVGAARYSRLSCSSSSWHSLRRGAVWSWSTSGGCCRTGNAWGCCSAPCWLALTASWW